MILAKIPENENKRLHDLNASGLLDSPQEEEFDEIVNFASSLCSMPISIISLTDSNRQWFKAKVGIEITEIKRETSFCAHAILSDGLFEIPDAFDDERFNDNPMVVEAPHIRFYAGMPLVTSSGSRLGTLCVINSTPGKLDDAQKYGLKLLANTIIKIAELRIKNRKLHYLGENQKKIISILAHDIRNPLVSIKNIIDLKQNDILDADEAAAMMELVGGQLNSTIKMVEDVVNWGQLQLQAGQQLHFDEINLSRLADTVFASIKLKSTEKKNNLVNLIAKEVTINTDKNILEFILRNLVSNANKFTQNGSITIYSFKENDRTLIHVSDTGVGMTSDLIASILNGNEFNPGLGTNNEKGSGLGLLLVKEFIDHINGSIFIESAVGKGTTFKIII